MNVVETRQDIEASIEQLETYRHSQDRREVEYYKGLVRRGICFVVTNRNGELVFSPSRFIGYVNNNLEAHESNASKDGRVTTPAISRILGKEPVPDETLEQHYQKFCSKLGVESGKGGQFGIRRKFWVL